MRSMLVGFGGACIATGATFLATEVVRLFVAIQLANRPPLGMGLALVTIGLIAIKVGLSR